MTNRNIIEEADRLLLKHGINELPLTFRKAEQIAQFSGWVIISYQDGEEIIKACGAEDIVKKRPAFTLMNDGRNIILYNNNLSYEHKLFCICHEFGHIVLKHTSEKNVLGISRDPAETVQQEQEANDFAAELLAPACVMSALGVRSAEQLRKYGLISPEQALRHVDNIKSFLPSTAAEKALVERFGHSKAAVAKVFLAVASVVLTIICVGLYAKQSRSTEPTVQQTSEISESLVNNNGEEYVYITRTGTRYHKSDCYHIFGKQTIEITAIAAEQAGYEPCKDCLSERQ